MPVSALTTFVDGNVLTAAQLNNEFANEYVYLNNKFNAASGHVHTGAIDDAPQIGTSGLALSALNLMQHTNLDNAKPAAPVPGMLDFATDAKLQYVYDGTAWQTVALLGRSQTWTAAQTLRQNGIGTTSTDVLQIQNVTAATSGVPVQQSPNAHYTGHAWDTGAVADKSVDFQSFVLPTSGNPVSGSWKLQSSVGGAAYTDVFTVTSTNLAQAKALAAGGLSGATAATRWVGGITNGPPATGTFLVGDFVIDTVGRVFVCTFSGTPGTWSGFGKSEAHIWLATPYVAVSTTSTTPVPPISGGWVLPWTYVASRWTTTSFGLEMCVYISNATYSINIDLYDQTAAAVVTGSTLNSTSTAPAWNSSISSTLIDGHNYYPRFSVTNSAATAYCLGARLRAN